MDNTFWKALGGAFCTVMLAWAGWMTNYVLDNVRELEDEIVGLERQMDARMDIAERSLLLRPTRNWIEAHCAIAYRLNGIQLSLEELAETGYTTIPMD